MIAVCFLVIQFSIDTSKHRNDSPKQANNNRKSCLLPRRSCLDCNMYKNRKKVIRPSYYLIFSHCWIEQQIVDDHATTHNTEKLLPSFKSVDLLQFLFCKLGKEGTKLLWFKRSMYHHWWKKGKMYWGRHQSHKTKHLHYELNCGLCTHAN